MDGITNGPHAGDTPTVLQSADVVELRRALAQAQQALALYELAGQELADLLRDHWKSPDADNMTIFLNAIIGGIVESWSKNPPPNGYTHAAEWPGIGKLEISIRTIKGKSAAESLRDREATLTQRDARIAELERARQAHDLAFGVCREIAQISPESLRKNGIANGLVVNARRAIEAIQAALATPCPACHGDGLERMDEHDTDDPCEACAGVGKVDAPEHPDTRRLDGVPGDLAEAILRMGRIEWGSTREQIDMEHLNDFADTLRITREAFPLGEKTKINGCYLEGTTTVLCHTGNSPNSPNNARIIVGLWNQLHDTLKTIDAAMKEADRG